VESLTKHPELENSQGQWRQNNAVWALSASQQIAPRGEAAARWKRDDR